MISQCIVRAKLSLHSHCSWENADEMFVNESTKRIFLLVKLDKCRVSLHNHTHKGTLIMWWSLTEFSAKLITYEDSFG